MKHLKSIVFVVFLIDFNLSPFGQITIYQDVFKGGTTGDAFNPWTHDTSGEFEINIETGSSIRKALLFINVYNNPSERTFYFDGTAIVINDLLTMENEYFYIYNSNIRKIRTILIDVTNLINPSQNIYSISPPQNQTSPSIGGLYSEFYLFVAYENPSLSELSTTVTVNNIQPNNNMNYFVDDLNSLDLSKNVGLSIHSSHICDTIEDGSFVFIEGNLIGLIGGEDDHSFVGSCSGVVGSFYFQDEQLFGLGNDIANTTMSGNDAIANIESYLNSNNTINLNFEYQSDWGPQTNPVHQLFLTYTSTCEPFEVSTPNDTTLCQGETLQLNVSGGQAYEWFPATGLSCADCPNPVFTADSSMFYTVRIWNNDTCSVVRPLKLNVRPQPEFGALTTSPSECGANTGTATLNALPNNGTVINWQEVGGATQTSNMFQNLSTGNHTFFFVDTNGCQSADTTVFVGEVNTTSASFSVSPQTGAVPLSVEFTNTSLNATNFEWFVEGVFIGSSFPTHEFSTSGTFEIILVAWQNDPSCADTAIQTVVVYDSLMISVPNVFTPNGDGVNDFFEITNSLPVHCELVIVNRWGNVMYEFSDKLGAGSTKLWDGYSLLFHGDMVEGTYFYDVTFSGANEQTLELEKLGILPIKKSGFVEVRR